MHPLKTAVLLPIAFFMLLIPAMTWAQDSLGVRKLSSLDTPDAAVNIVKTGNYVYIADRNNTLNTGLRIIDVTNPRNPLLAGVWIASGQCWGIDVVGSYAYVGDGGSLKIVNIANPSSPIIVGSVTFSTSTVTGIKVLGNYAYIGQSSGWFQIVNITNPLNPLLVGNLNVGAEISHVTVDGQFAYITTLGNQLKVVNVVNPSVPSVVSQTSFPDPLPRSVFVQGNYAYVADNSAGLRILDISNNLSEIGFFDTPGWALNVEIIGNLAYIADYAGGGIRIVDVSNPASPEQIGYYLTHNNTHRITVDGNIIYAADAISGLGIYIFETLESTPNTLSFVNQPLFETDSLELLIRCYQNSPFRYTFITGASSGVFSHRVEDSDSLTDANDFLRIWVRFRPDSTLTYRDTLRLTFEAPYNPIAIPISGTGVGTYAHPINSTINFPRTVEPTLYDSIAVRVVVAGNQPLTNLSFVDTDVFAFGDVSGSFNPGDTALFWLYFGPGTQGTFSQRIGLIVHAINADTLWLNVTGTSSYVPAPPRNLTVTVSGEDALLNWARVDTSLNGVPLTVQRYLIAFRNSNTIPWQYLWATFGADATSFTHISVARYSPAMFYQVSAWIGDGDSFDSVVRDLPAGTPLESVMKRLGRKTTQIEK